MSSPNLDITYSMDWEDGLPRPQWEMIESWIDSRFEPRDRPEAWTGVKRQWLARLGPAIGVGYEVLESDHFLILLSRDDEGNRQLLPFAERCWSALMSGLAGVTILDGQGKLVVLVLRNTLHYYRYIAQHFPEGDFGTSAGVQLRSGAPHIAILGTQLWSLEVTLAHELTHASLQHLAMPLWLEEGLAMMFEHDMTGYSQLNVDDEMLERHKQRWGKHGLNKFWRGEGFSRSGKIQELSYQLAEILVRLLVEESRPRWFGWVREPQVRFFAFLQEASETDCGSASCQKHLGYGLGELAAKFLGPGKWSPRL